MPTSAAQSSRRAPTPRRSSADTTDIAALAEALKTWFAGFDVYTDGSELRVIPTLRADAYQRLNTEDRSAIAGMDPDGSIWSEPGQAAESPGAESRPTL